MCSGDIVIRQKMADNPNMLPPPRPGRATTPIPDEPTSSQYHLGQVTPSYHSNAQGTTHSEDHSDWLDSGVKSEMVSDRHVDNLHHSREEESNEAAPPPSCPQNGSKEQPDDHDSVQGNQPENDETMLDGNASEPEEKPVSESDYNGSDDDEAQCYTGFFDWEGLYKRFQSEMYQKEKEEQYAQMQYSQLMDVCRFHWNCLQRV